MTESLFNSTFKYAFDNCIPLTTTFEITPGCNFKCSHCYNFDRTAAPNQEIFTNKLTHDEILKTIDAIAALGTIYLNLTGGEVLTYPHLYEVIERGRQNHLEVRMKTNASLLTEKVCAELKAAGLKGMDVSLYGSSEASYKNLTETGKLSTVVAGIKNAKAAGLDVIVSIILQKYNIAEYNEMINLCKSLDVIYKISYEITGRYDDTESSRDLEMTAEDFTSLLTGENGEVFMTKHDGEARQCSCARSVLGIGSNGDIYPCIGAPIKAGNIRDNIRSDVWKDSEVFNDIRGLKKESFKDCESCSLTEYCVRSSGSIYVNTGEYTGCEPSVYNQAQIRKDHEYLFTT